MEGLLYAIEEKLPALSVQHKKIAACLLKSPDKIVWMSIKDLADWAEVSPAAISRFCQSFGFSGFGEMKIVLSQELVKYNENSFADMASEDFKNNIAQNLLKKDIASFCDTAALLETDKLLQAAKLIKASNDILCAGIGASNLVAQDMMQKLLRIQKRALYYSDYDLRKVALAQFGKADLVFLVSYSGKKAETLELAEMASAQGVPIIALTRVGDTPLSRLATVSFQAAAYEDEYRTSAVSSRLAHLYLVDTIFYTYGLFFQEKAFEKLRKTHEMINSTSVRKD